MPDSPAPSSMVSDSIPKVSSPGQLHISTSNAQMVLEGRPPISAPNNALPNGFHAASPNQPLSPGILNGMQLPPTCGVRQLSKLKRFLTTLQQFGSDISPDIGERVRGLIVNLVNNAITVEEFHQQLQEATNFPLRPFVIPFLKTNLPLLQQELLQCSQLSKRSPQPPHQFVGSDAHERERIKNENDEFAFDHIGTKRKSEYERPKENGHHLDHSGISPSKQRKSPSSGFDSDATAIVEHLMESLKQDTDEWRNLETILQCVVSFVDKAKRSMAMIQERCLRDREEMTSWARSMAAETEAEVKRRTAEQVAKTMKDSEDRVNEVKRRAEEAVSDVKRQAVVELQKAVSAAEDKANDALSQVHQQMEQAVQEARRQATEETSNLINQQESSKENCWNCGRKANETCSGCNVARYCGKFCQHKDWEQHQKNCGKQPKQHNSMENTHSPLDSNRANSPTRSNTPRVISSGKISPGPTVSSDNTIATSVPVSVMQVSSASS